MTDPRVELIVMDLVTKEWTDTATMDQALAICLRAIDVVGTRRPSSMPENWRVKARHVVEIAKNQNNEAEAGRNAVQLLRLLLLAA